MALVACVAWPRPCYSAYSGVARRQPPHQPRSMQNIRMSDTWTGAFSRQPCPTGAAACSQPVANTQLPLLLPPLSLSICLPLHNRRRLCRTRPIQRRRPGVSHCQSIHAPPTELPTPSAAVPQFSMSSSAVQPAPGDAIHAAASVGFGSAESTAAYERGRPSYPVAVVDLLIQQALLNRPPPAAGEAEALHVLDVGAGTGIFTRLLAARLQHFSTAGRTFRVTAVEPVAGMRDKFREVTSADIDVLDGSGSNLAALPDSSVAAIFAAQSFHWFSTSATLKEFARVLAPGGAVALIWNTRDRSCRWVDALETIIDEYYTPDVPRQQSGEFKRTFAAEPAFSPLHAHIKQRAMQQTGDLSVMLDRVNSISVISALPDDEKKRAQQRLTRVLTQHSDTAGLTQYTLPYITEAYWSYKL